MKGMTGRENLASVDTRLLTCPKYLAFLDIRAVRCRENAVLLDTSTCLSARHDPHEERGLSLCPLTTNHSLLRLYHPLTKIIVGSNPPGGATV